MRKSLLLGGLALIALSVCAAWALARETESERLAEAAISFDQARSTALDAVPGGRIVEEEIEREDGRLIFSFDVATGEGGAVRDVEVDAVTGELIRTEPDDDGPGDDDDDEAHDIDDDAGPDSDPDDLTG